MINKTLFVIIISSISCACYRYSDNLKNLKEDSLTRSYIVYLNPTCQKDTIVSLKTSKLDSIKQLSNISIINPFYVKDSLKLFITSQNLIKSPFSYSILLFKNETVDTVKVNFYPCLKGLKYEDFNKPVIDTIFAKCANSQSIYIEYNGTVGFLSLKKDDKHIFKKKEYSTIDRIDELYSLDMVSNSTGNYTFNK